MYGDDANLGGGGTGEGGGGGGGGCSWCSDFYEIIYKVLGSTSVVGQHIVPTVLW